MVHENLKEWQRKDAARTLRWMRKMRDENEKKYRAESDQFQRNHYFGLAWLYRHEISGYRRCLEDIGD